MTVQPKGSVVVMVLVQVGDCEQVVRVVVPGEVAGLVGQIWGMCQDRRLRGGEKRVAGIPSCNECRWLL